MKTELNVSNREVLLRRLGTILADVEATSRPDVVWIVMTNASLLLSASVGGLIVIVEIEEVTEASRKVAKVEIMDAVARDGDDIVVVPISVKFSSVVSNVITGLCRDSIVVAVLDCDVAEAVMYSGVVVVV